MAKSQYEKLYAGKRRGGRPKLDPDEKARREARQKVEYRRRNEARRRAAAVLKHNHPDEFDSIYEVEYDALAGDTKYDVALMQSKSATKKG